MENVRPTLTAPSYLLNARRLYKQSTATVIDWFAANGAPKSGKNASSGVKRDVTVKEILSYAQTASKRKTTAPRYIHSAFETALINRRRMTAWYRENELGPDADSIETAKHEHFTTTLNLACTTLFVGGRAESSPSSPSPDMKVEEPLSNNTFGALEDLPTDKPSTLSESEMHAHLEEWASTNLRSKSSIVDDPFDEFFDHYHYVLEMDYVASVVKKYWRMAAAGAIEVPLAAWLTTAGFTAVKLVCETYQNVGGVTTEVLVQDYLQRKAQMQIATGEDQSAKESKLSGHEPLYKRFSSSTAIITPVEPMRHAKITHAEALKNPATFSKQTPAKPTEYIKSSKQEMQEEVEFQMQTCLIISDPEKLELPEEEAQRVLALYEKRNERDTKCFESMLRSIIQVHMKTAATDSGQVLGPEKAIANPMLAETVEYLKSRRSITPRTEALFGLTLLLETGKSFFWRDDQPNPTNLRIKALQLASEVKESVRNVIDREANAGIHRNAQENTIHRTSVLA